MHLTADTPVGSIGVPNEVPGSDVAIIDPDTREECPRAEFDDAGQLTNGDSAVGEIVNLGGPVGFEGYYANDEATAERIRNGWYWTGDLGYRDSAGFFYFAGRSSDRLRVDSENFAAAPIERILQRHPLIAVAAVYPVPDARTGDQVMAALELAPGGVLTPTELDKFLAEQADLGTKWAPRYIRFVARMPVTGTNKVAKSSLRRQRWEPDEVWWRAGSSYQPMTDADRDAIRGEFRNHGRIGLLDAVV